MSKQTVARAALIDKYQSYLDRLGAWERSETERLRNRILVPHFDGNGCCLHNWMLNYERDGSCISREVYKLGKYFNWKQQQIWDTHKRLQRAFYDKLMTAYRMAA